MNGNNGDALVAMSTRNQKKNGYQDPKLILNNMTEDQDEAQGLVRDRIFHDFVEVKKSFKLAKFQINSVYYSSP